jgi:hypothetical protein
MIDDLVADGTLHPECSKILRIDKSETDHREAWNLVAELEVVEDMLHVGREAVQIGLEVGH